MRRLAQYNSELNLLAWVVLLALARAVTLS